MPFSHLFQHTVARDGHGQPIGGLPPPPHHFNALEGLLVHSAEHWRNGLVGARGWKRQGHAGHRQAKEDEEDETKSHFTLSIFIRAHGKSLLAGRE